MGIGKDIEGMAVSLGDGKRAMCNEPKEQVPQLTQPSADALANPSLVKYQPL